MDLKNRVLLTWTEHGSPHQEEHSESEAALRLWALSKRSTVLNLRAWREVQPETEAYVR